MLDPQVIQQLHEDYESLDHSLIDVISTEYDNENEVREVLESLHNEAIASEVDWTDFDNIPIEDIESEPKSVSAPHEDDEDLSDDLKFLRQSFPSIPLASIKHKYKSCNGDLDKVVDLLLNQSLIDEEISDEDKYFQNFSSKSKTKKHDLSSHFKEQKKSFEYRNNSIQTLCDILGIDEKDASKLFDDNDQSLTKCLLSVNKSNRPESTIQQQPLQPTRPTIRRKSISGKSRSILTAKAEENFDKRQEAIEHAQQMYRKSKSNALYRSAAGYYAEIASNHGMKGHEAMNDMYRSLVESRSTKYKIDFHGVPLHIAIDIAIIKIQDWWTNETTKIGRTLAKNHLTLITGAGYHSDAGVPKIKNAIRKLLKEEEWKYQEGSSYFIITGCK